ncbi:MAG: glucuronate isomerase, partial [Clostridia bacterium]|nr:glucuronate isomerase [Clostridia bacterium]
NPIYHWTALELKRYFDIDEPLTERSAKAIWDHCNKKIGQPDFSARTLIERSNVQALCTTDDPADSLGYHKQLQDEKWGVSVLPTFRPDKAVNIDAVWFEGYLKDNGIADYDALVAWLKKRIAFFHEIGCRLSDHALDYVPYAVGNAREILEKKLSGAQLTITEIDAFKTAVLQVCAAEYARLGWAMQLHIGAMRNNNSVMFKKLGPDTGFDSINDREIAEKLSAFLNSLESEDCLPKTILYTLNPKDNFVLGTMLGNFQKGPTPSKIQFGSGWWFNDHRDGMEEQLQALANLGVLGKFVGMLTDSRSFVSYPRHEYFRRIFCNLIGKWVENGEYPNDREALGAIVRGVCHDNAEVYFAFDK